MLKPILIFVGLIAAGIAAMALLWVAYAIIAIYVYAPLKHRKDVAAAERLNDETYRSGNGYAFEVGSRSRLVGRSAPRRGRSLAFRNA